MPPTSPGGAFAGPGGRTAAACPATPGRSGTASQSGNCTPAGSGDAGTGSSADIRGTVLDRLLEAASEILRHSGFLVAGGALLLLFLLVQDQLDRRDPKLALAPVHPDPDLPFEDPPTMEDLP
ncbi:hypothetical protein [Kineococcus sp. SYSU DK004]|uniref:hypothetical protein n=1 Tax=Kineococcus sp. SYSU DK004 TaxID=3383125 RepID=UPI003D7D05CB